MVVKVLKSPDATFVTSGRIYRFSPVCQSLSVRFERSAVNHGCRFLSGNGILRAFPVPYVRFQRLLGVVDLDSIHGAFLVIEYCLSVAYVVYGVLRERRVEQRVRKYEHAVIRSVRVDAYESHFVPTDHAPRVSYGLSVGSETVYPGLAYGCPVAVGRSRGNGAHGVYRSLRFVHSSYLRITGQVHVLNELVQASPYGVSPGFPGWVLGDRRSPHGFHVYRFERSAYHVRYVLVLRVHAVLRGAPRAAHPHYVDGSLVVYLRW